MADYDPPADLLKLKRDYFAADARCQELTDALPSNVDVLEGRAERDEATMADLTSARSDRMELVEQIHRHGWWKEVDNRHSAWMALQKIAKD